MENMSKNHDHITSNRSKGTPVVDPAGTRSVVSVASNELMHKYKELMQNFKGNNRRTVMTTILPRYDTIGVYCQQNHQYQ